MLTLILGRAGTGKTAFVMSEIRRRMGGGERGLLLVVPEQYSHDAERQLCDICGDRLSLHGETLSFTRMFSRAYADIGIAQPRVIDAGGQILAMYRALEAAAPTLRVFGKRSMRADLLEKLLDTVRELKMLNISPESLNKMAKSASKPLAEKLRDISLVYGAYEGFLNIHGIDPSDMLTLLANVIGSSGIGDTGGIYFDGFNDFTAQEMRVVAELMRKNADLTVCLTFDPADDADEGWEAFKIPRDTAAKLRRIAEDCGVEINVITTSVTQREDAGKFGDAAMRQCANQPLCAAGGAVLSVPPPVPRAAELLHLERHMFQDGDVPFAGECGGVRVYAAPSRYAECEYAAHSVWELVRSGYRWRDIGVMARDWVAYGSLCENVFEKYGVPFFTSGREDIMGKPPAALIDAALEIATSGWEYKPVFRYLKTGLAGISNAECSELENYAIRWNLRGYMWGREWVLPPSGYRGKSEEATLARLNEIRKQVTAPLFRLRDRIKGISESSAKLRALYAFFEEVKLPENIAEKAQMLEERGEARLADEYAQLWDIIVNAMDQTYAVLGDTPVSAYEFRKLFSLALSRYDVGVIPVSLDRTALGGMAMSRRRDLKCLIVLGATDGTMPMLTGNSGALSDRERLELHNLGADMPAGLEERLCREMNMLYSTLTLPSQLLIMSYPTGGGTRPSYIVKRIMTMFDTKEITLREEEYMTSAETPCFELAALSGHTNASRIAAAAREFFAGESEDAYNRLVEADIALRAGRSRLSRRYAQMLYGRELSLSASRVDKYYACPFAHFVNSGLRLDQREYAGFDAPEAGIFMHYVLEGVSREIKSSCGFKNTDEQMRRDLTVRYIEKYANEVLYGFEGKNARFVYLFRRLERDIQRIVIDMLDELNNSNFEPRDFEVDLSQLANLANVKDRLNLIGKIDRVDSWTNSGRTYLRVIDYKTGRKSFELSDVLHGRDMQMLIYLFALNKYGGLEYGAERIPAGVLYVPARDIIVKAARNTPEDELDRLRSHKLRRGGLVLSDPVVIEAMENGESKKYLPVKYTKEGEITGDSLVTSEQVDLLSVHVSDMLRSAADEIIDGVVACSPYYKGPEDNACTYCEFHSVCGFDETLGDKRRFVRKQKPAEVWGALEAKG